MSRGYKNLTWHDRLKIEQMTRTKFKQREIAAAVHVDQSTISRELKRGRYPHLNSDLTTEERYSPDIAQKRFEQNKTAKGKSLKIGNDHRLAEYIETKIADDKFSPGAVIGEITNAGLQFSVTICERTLYNYIDAGLFLRITNKDLPFKGTRRTERTKHVRPARASKGDSIEKRPEHINTRAEFGHWEMDTLISARPGKKCALVLTERMTRQQKMIPMIDRTAVSAVSAIDGIERKYGGLFSAVFKTITIDNGGEFSDCGAIEGTLNGERRTKLFYCHPYSAYERGSNEKQNQMIRRFFPKGTNFDSISDGEIERVTDWLNRYPRKMFGWGCSEQRFTDAIQSI